MPRKKIGLALGSGAARGWAHIGVINELTRLGLNFDIVAGCSAGGLVGAAYACNKLSELEQWVRSFKSWDIMRLSDLTWRKGGLLYGKKAFNAIAKILQIENIQDCPIKFATVATNLSTGRELWLTKGNLQMALRASCSIPGLLAPVYFNNSWLVDGALVNPLPISLARALGADIVIAVDLHNDANLEQHLPILDHDEHDDYAEDEKNKSKNWRKKISSLLERNLYVPSAFQIMNTSIELLENRLKNSRIANDPPDILFQPECYKISLFDFHRAAEIIEIGSNTVLNNSPLIEEKIKKMLI